MLDSNAGKSYLKEFNDFLNQLHLMFENNENTITELNIINNIMKEEDEKKVLRGKQFHKCLDDNDLFDLFLNMKVNSFSSKNDKSNSLSNSLLGEDLPLKKLVNKQTEKTRDIIWNYLHAFYILNQKQLNESKLDVDDKNRINLLLEKSTKLTSMVNILNTSKDESVKRKSPDEVLGIDLNPSTNLMINDIISSFEKNISTNDNQNPMESIFSITNEIASKYTDKIESGEIELDSILNSMKDKLPGLDKIASNFGLDKNSSEPKKEVTIIDENFTTDQVNLGQEKSNDNGLNLANGLKMLNTMNSGNSEMGEMLSGLIGGADMEKMMSSLQNNIISEMTINKENTDSLDEL